MEVNRVGVADIGATSVDRVGHHDSRVHGHCAPRGHGLRLRETKWCAVQADALIAGSTVTRRREIVTVLAVHVQQVRIKSERRGI